MRQPVFCALMILAAGTAIAQERQPKSVDVRKIEIAKANAEGKLMTAVEMKTITGAPYSGEATTEFVQSLADGNRIVRRTATRIFRDSEGRVRRENLAADGATIESVTIVDPTSGKSLTLNPETKTAYGESKTLTMFSARGGTWTARGNSELSPLIIKRELELRTALETLAGKIAQRGSDEHTTREDLGQRTIEGLTARGTRTTTVIPAGDIGNEQPIQIVSEEWFSPDLQILLLTKHSDPRSGETTYTLANITRAEPARSLFDIPADYTLQPPIKRR